MIRTSMHIIKRCKAAPRKKPTSGTSYLLIASLPCLTYCRVYITSDEFKSKMQPARHRMVYTLLKDELAAEGGIHALQLKTKTTDEAERAKAKEESSGS